MNAKGRLLNNTGCLLKSSLYTCSFVSLLSQIFNTTSTGRMEKTPQNAFNMNCFKCFKSHLSLFDRTHPVTGSDLLKWDCVDYECESKSEVECVLSSEPQRHRLCTKQGHCEVDVWFH